MSTASKADNIHKASDNEYYVTRALHIFEKSKYGRVPVSETDFACLEQTIRELKL